MQTNKIIYLTSLAFLAVASFVACHPQKAPSKIEGFAPIYMSLSQIKNIETLAPQTTINAGKIYQYGNNLTFQADVRKGIHVIDCSNPSAPVKLKFISIPGASEIAIKNNMLITNNFTDLVSLDISNLNDIKVINRVTNVYNVSEGLLPDASNTFFECPDKSKGIVIGWEKKTLTDPKCKTL
jgi:hypothetical protein